MSSVRRFRRFRRSRPFWAGACTILAGAEIVLLPLTPLADLGTRGVGGVTGLLTGAVLVLLGAFLWSFPAHRTPAGVLVLAVSLASFVLSHLGGLVVGMLLGLLGGSLALTWTPPRPARGRRAGSGKRRLLRQGKDPEGPPGRSVAGARGRGSGADDPDDADDPDNPDDPADLGGPGGPDDPEPPTTRLPRIGPVP